MKDFELIYRSFFTDVELYLRTLCRDDTLAEELAAQCFFRAMQALPKFKGNSDIKTWLCAIAKNCWLDHLRKQSKTSAMEPEQADPGVPLEQRCMDRDQAMQIHRALHQLPEPYKEVFSLRVFGELSFSQIGTIFGKTQNWACVTYHRAKQKITDALEE